MQKMRTFSRNACATSGNDSVKSCRSKNALRTAGQPAELTIARTTIAANTTVLATAIPIFRASPPWREPRIFERRAVRPVSASTLTRPGSLLEDGRVRLVRQPLRLDLLERAVALERGERLVQARRQLAPLREHHPEVLGRAHGRELPDDGRVRDLDRGDVERGGQVDDDAVDLVRVQRRVDVVGRVVDRRLLRRLDVVLDVGVARGADLGAELVLLDVRD